MNRFVCRAYLIPRKLFFYSISKNIYSSSMAKSITISDTDNRQIKDYVQFLLPDLKYDNHKGQCGRIGVFGGSLEFTGAPYYSGYSALRCGVDLVYVFCASSAAQAIKSYSPELMVMPYLDSENGLQDISNWLERLHAILIGPGLGRNGKVFEVLIKVINILNTSKPIPLVFDADGLFFLTCYPSVLKNYNNNVYITPNIVEYSRLVKSIFGKEKTKHDLLSELGKSIGDNVTVVLKGHIDSITQNNVTINCATEGSPRRCGGQGDLLAGLLTAFAAWIDIKKPQFQNDKITPELVAAYSACHVVRNCNRIVYSEKGRGMIVTDMLEKVLEVCSEYYEESTSNKKKYN